MRLDELGQQFSLGRSRLPGLPLRAARRQVLAQLRPSPLHRAVGRGNADAEQVGGLGGRPAEHVADYQRGTLPRRQHLEGRQERQFDGLAPDSRVGWLVARGYLVQQRIRIGLQPGQVGVRRDRRRTARPLPQHVQAGVRGDAVEPRPVLRSVAKTSPAAPGPQQDLLHGVLSVVERGKHPVAVHVQLPPVQPGQLVERGLVASSRGRGQAGVRAQCAASPALTSWTIQPLPSGSLNDKNEP